MENLRSKNNVLQDLGRESEFKRIRAENKLLKLWHKDQHAPDRGTDDGDRECDKIVRDYMTSREGWVDANFFNDYTKVKRDTNNWHYLDDAERMSCILAMKESCGVDKKDYINSYENVIKEYENLFDEIEK